MFQNLDWSVALGAMPFLLTGLVRTVQISVLAIILGLALGWLLGFFSVSNSRILQAGTKAYVEFIRGTPLLVQIFLVYFGLGGLGINLTAFWAGVVALGLNTGAFQAEIVRAGIQSIDRAQTEAAKSIGLGGTQTLIFILVPQAVRRVIPPLTNELIALIKGSSLLTIIAVSELTHAGQLTVARTFAPFEIYTAVAFLYLGIVSILSRFSVWMEKRIPIY